MEADTRSGVAHQVDAVLDGLGHLLDVLAQVVDAVAVVHGAVRLQRVAGAQAVFHHHHGDAVAAVDLVQGVAQALGVDLPAPVGSLQVGIFEPAGQVAVGLGRVGVGGDAVGHIVAEGVEIDGALLQQLQVARLDLEPDIVLVKEPLGVAGVLAADLDVGAEPRQDLLFRIKSLKSS